MPTADVDAHDTGTSYEQLLSAGAWASLRAQCPTNYAKLKLEYTVNRPEHRFHTRALRAELYTRSGRNQGTVSSFYFFLWVAEHVCCDPSHTHQYDYTRK